MDNYTKFVHTFLPWFVNFFFLHVCHSLYFYDMAFVYLYVWHNVSSLWLLGTFNVSANIRWLIFREGKPFRTTASYLRIFVITHDVKCDTLISAWLGLHIGGFTTRFPGPQKRQQKTKLVLKYMRDLRFRINCAYYILQENDILISYWICHNELNWIFIKTRIIFLKMSYWKAITLLIFVKGINIYMNYH